MPPPRKRNKCLKKGDNFVVTIEELVNDCILVSLIYENRKFCGALMDTTKTSGPYGIPQDEIKPKEENLENETPPDPEIYHHKNPFPQPLLIRKSYNQKVPQPAQRNVFRRARRSRRKARMNMLRSTGKDLRQRNWKFLSHIANCKCAECVVGVDRKNEQSTSNSKLKSEPLSSVKLEKFKDDTPETSSDDERRSVNLPEEIASPIKNLLPRKSQTVQRSPIIKITFKSPGGRGRTIKIPSKLHSPTRKKFSGKGRAQKLQPVLNDEVRNTGSSASSSENLPGPSCKDSSLSKNRNLKRSQLSHAKKEQASRILKRAKLSSVALSSSAGKQAEPSEMELRVILQPLEPQNDIASQGNNHNQEPGQVNEPNTISIDVSTCKTLAGIVTQGDIVWGKLTGYPWWPSKIVKLTTKKTDGKILQQFATVSWFPKSSTTSVIPLKNVKSFKKCYNERFQKNRKGVYQKAVKAADDALNLISPEVRKLIAQFET